LVNCFYAAQDVALLKENSFYYSKDKITATKIAQKVIKRPLARDMGLVLCTDMQKNNY
jgi:hypothetical protein